MFSTFYLNNLGNLGCIMDIGAIDHVHSNEDILKSISNNHGTSFIYVGNRPKMPINMTGHTTLLVKNQFHTLHLNNVLIIPNIIKNLISIRKFTCDKNISLNLMSLVLLPRITGTNNL